MIIPKRRLAPLNVRIEKAQQSLAEARALLDRMSMSRLRTARLRTACTWKHIDHRELMDAAFWEDYARSMRESGQTRVGAANRLITDAEAELAQLLRQEAAKKRSCVRGCGLRHAGKP